MFNCDIYCFIYCIFQFKLGKVYNRLSFYYSGYGLRGGDDFISATEASEKSIAVVDQALKLFEEVSYIITIILLYSLEFLPDIQVQM